MDSVDVQEVSSGTSRSTFANCKEMHILVLVSSLVGAGMFATVIAVMVHATGARAGFVLVLSAIMLAFCMFFMIIGLWGLLARPAAVTVDRSGITFLVVFWLNRVFWRDVEEIVHYRSGSIQWRLRGTGRTRTFILALVEDPEGLVDAIARRAQENLVRFTTQ